MESPRKFNDCYFYYYSTCTKGDNCVFRHEPSALGCETMCAAWQQGKCLDKRCKLRHMELRKNRKQIPCYWENQPGGCRKIHCPFMHKNPEARTDGIAPSQPAPPQAAGMAGPVGVPEAGPELGVSGVPPVAAVPAPQPVPLLWQQQRQAVVLDSAILGVLPGSGELLGGRRVLGAHPHEGYAPLPVDPLVVNFEEESDTESVPSSTPTKKITPDEAEKIARSKSEELLQLEKIQAESAAYYNYNGPAPAVVRDRRKIVRTNLSTKYEKVSLDELSGKKLQLNTAKHSSLDFKILTLDEIRARKNNSVIHNKPLTTLSVNRKRKLSTQETVTASGNKMIKLVRKNSVVYKKIACEPPAVPASSKVEQKPNADSNKKEKLSEQSADVDRCDNELVDNCFEFKKIKIPQQAEKPMLIRKSVCSSDKSADESKSDESQSDVSKSDTDSDGDVVMVEPVNNKADPMELSETEDVIIDLDSPDLDDIIDIGGDDCDVPDVVASCSQQAKDCADEDALLNNIDDLLYNIDDEVL